MYCHVISQFYFLRTNGDYVCAPECGAARRKTSAGRAYLQIVDNRRDGAQARQQAIATLGRFKDLQANGQERLVHSSTSGPSRAEAARLPASIGVCK
jgi:hypothetical protein